MLSARKALHIMKRCLGCMREMENELTICPHCGYAEGTPPKEIYHMMPGTYLHEKYLIGRVIGYGGFGITYVGWDIKLERKVAIKEFMPSEFSTRMPGETFVTVYNGEATEQFGAGLERFIEEAQRLAKFNHVPSIVDIYDTFIENNTGYIVMQFLEGDTVKELLAKNGVMPYESAKLIIMQILETLSVVHKEGIIHRDISPDNIFITVDNEIKLLDFGAARYASGFHSKSLSVILKPGYAPEEQYRSRGNQGPWSDVYATSATLYKMITGITIEESMERAVKDDVKSPAELGVSLPESANTAIMNALNIHTELRTQSADDFIKELTSDDVVRIIDKPKKNDAGKIPLWLKITAASVLSVAVIFGVLVMTGVLNIKGILSPVIVADDSVRVPFVINEMKDDGEKKLNEKGFAMQITDQAYDEFAAKDIIKSQTPESGSIGAECQTRDEQSRPVVFVVVSGGHAPVMVPNIVGLTVEEAKQWLASIGFNAEIKEVYSQTEPAGAVIGQDIVDVEYEYGSSIIITVSKGEMQVDPSKTHIVPSLEGMSYDEAVNALMQIGMYTSKTERASDAQENHVLEQSVASGTEMPEGTTVTLVVSSNTIVIPNVKYKNVQEAANAISAAGARVEIRYEKNSQVAANHVISQDKSGKGTYGTTVILTVSKPDGNAAEPIINTPTPQTPAPRTPTPSTPAPTVYNTTAPRTSAPNTPTPQTPTPQTPKPTPQEDYVQIPNIIGMNLGNDYGVAYDELVRRYPSLDKAKVRFATSKGGSKPSGCVTSTTPTAGTLIKAGTKLTIYIEE